MDQPRFYTREEQQFKVIADRLRLAPLGPEVKDAVGVYAFLLEAWGALLEDSE